jgi:hypothetical protein
MRKLAALFATTLTVGSAGVYGADRAANPYDDKGTHYELPIVSDIPQGERVEIAKDRAAMTLKGWNDEYAITITPQIPAAPTFGAAEKIDRPFDTAADRPLLSQQMQFREGDVTAFIEPKEGTANEFDIDFTLHASPPTNVFEYKIEGAEQFEFFYQPELTPEEIAEGAERPENAIGSYAVYHTEKANHRVGSTNYATGKVFHIYRPKAIDANGAEVWADLSYSEGVLAVTVPEKWLKTAAYPVIVDPTLGYTNAGASFLSFTNDGIIATGSYSFGGGDLTNISFYTNTGGNSRSVRGGVYNSDNTFAGGSANDTAISTVQWLSPSLILNLGSGTFLLALFRDASTSGNVVRFYYDATGVLDYRSQTVTFPNWPNPHSLATNNTLDRELSVYITYTASGGGGSVAPDDGVVWFE